LSSIKNGLISSAGISQPGMMTEAVLFVLGLAAMIHIPAQKTFLCCEVLLISKGYE